jgi:hypothetical protein
LSQRNFAFNFFGNLVIRKSEFPILLICGWGSRGGRGDYLRLSLFGFVATSIATIIKPHVISFRAIAIFWHKRPTTFRLPF